MRIIAGTHRGRLIKMPKGKTRPTQDRVREALFNIIRERIPGSKVLDLYAGSGAFGIEALSRGAYSSIFIDNNIKCIKAIKANLSSLGYDSQPTQVFKKEAVKAITAFAKKGMIFDIIFMDPPYYKGSLASRGTSLAKNSLIKIDAYDIVSKHAFVVCEHFVKDPMPEEVGKLTLIKRRRYGDTAVSIYRRHCERTK